MREALSPKPQSDQGMLLLSSMPQCPSHLPHYFITDETQVTASSLHHPPLDFSLHACSLCASFQHPLTKIQTPETAVYLSEEDEYVKVDVEDQELDHPVCHRLLPARLVADIIQAILSPPSVQASAREQHHLVRLQFRYLRH